MKRRLHRPAAALLAVSLPLVGIAAARSDPGAGRAAKPVRLADATMIVEVNATDGDAGLQVFLDGEPWRSMRVSDPNGRRILDVKTRGRVRRYGLTELFSESSEPPFERFPLSRFKRLFPEGRYRFAGTTIEGRRLVGSARLSHDIPDGPQITSPAAGASIPRDGVVAAWKPAAQGGGIDITGYRAIVEREDPLRVFSADLPAAVTSVTIPREYLEPGTDYKLEVQAIEASGNQTLTEVEFTVR
jgi:fibronectin type III domain protein